MSESSPPSPPPSPPEFKPLTPEQAKQVMMQWKRAAPMLEEQRERDIRASDTVRSMYNLDDVFEEALSRHEPAMTSGLVVLQRLAEKARRQACKN